MSSLQELQKEIDRIKARNRKVEADKAWETCWTRKALVLALTYAVLVVFFYYMQLEAPFINAIVPAIAFVISTLTVPAVKKWWVRRVYRKK